MVQTDQVVFLLLLCFLPLFNSFRDRRIASSIVHRRRLRLRRRRHRHRGGCRASIVFGWQVKLFYWRSSCEAIFSLARRVFAKGRMYRRDCESDGSE